MLKSTDKKYLAALLLALFPITGVLGIQWFALKHKKVGIIWLLTFIAIMSCTIFNSNACESNSSNLYSCIDDFLAPWAIFILSYIASVISILVVTSPYLGTRQKSRAATKGQLLFSLITTIVSSIGFIAFFAALFNSGDLGFLYVHLYTISGVIFSLPGFICIFSLLLILCNCIALFFNKNFLNYVFIIFFAALGNTLLAIFSVWQLALMFPRLF